MTMPIINLQKRSRELGRIRLGQKGDRGQPQKLDRFRFTANSEVLLTKIAELYGGEVREWTGGTQKYEVISDAVRLPIMVPPQPVTQWHEAWRKSGCIHRCTGEVNVLTDEPCDPEDPVHREALEKPTTRLNVVLRDVEGVGVWRVETKGWYAAMELPDVAAFLAQAGGYVNGWLALDPREDHGVKDGKPFTHHYLVPIIEVDVTPAQLMAGHGRVAAPALTGGPVGETPALAAAGPDYVALAAEIKTADEIRALWIRANDAGHMTQGLSEHLQKRAEDLRAAAAPPASELQKPGEEGPVDAVTVDEPATTASADGEPDPDVVWAQVVKAAGERGMTLPDLEDDVATFFGGMSSAEASGSELAEYLKDLQARPTAAGAA